MEESGSEGIGIHPHSQVHIKCSEGVVAELREGPGRRHYSINSTPRSKHCRLQRGVHDKGRYSCEAHRCICDETHQATFALIKHG